MTYRFTVWYTNGQSENCLVSGHDLEDILIKFSETNGFVLSWVHNMKVEKVS